MTQPTPTDVARIWDALGNDLEAYLRRRTGDPTTAADLRQEVMLRVHQRRGALRDEDRLAAWVFSIARNLLVDHYRARRPVHPLTDEVVERIADPTHTEPVLEPSPAAVLGHWLTAMIDTLDEPYRTALRLTEVEGISQRQAAHRLDLSYSGFKSRVQRGRAKLRKLLDQCCEVELDGTGKVVGFTPRDRKTPSNCGC